MKPHAPTSAACRLVCSYLSIVVFIFVGQPAQGALLDDIFSTISTVHTRVRDVQTRMINTQSRMIDVQSRIGVLGENTDEIVLQVRSGLEALTENVQAAIAESIEDVQSGIDEIRAGQQAFIEEEATVFRSDMIAFMDNIGALLNSIGDIGGASEVADFDLSRLRSLLESAPDRALFPLSRGIKAVNLSKINETMSRAATAMGDVAFLILDQDEAAAAAQGAALLSGNASAPLTEAMNNPALVEAAIRTLKISSIVLNATGDTLNALGEAVQTEKDIGIHGYVHITVKSNVVKTIGTILGGLGSCFDQIAGFVSDKQSAIELQAWRDELAGRMSSIEAMDLRVKIESHLVSSNRQLAVFFLPQSQGGLLEVVRDIVDDTIAQSRESGLYDGALANQYLSEGNSYFDTGDHRAAFEQYRKAYLEATEWALPAAIESGDSADEFRISWKSEQGADYAVETSEELVQWHDLYLIINAADGVAEVKRTASEPTEFYRVIRKDQ